MWFNIAIALTFLALAGLTLSYWRHDPATCTECQRRKHGLISSQHPTQDQNLCQVCGEPVWDQTAHNRYWHS